MIFIAATDASKWSTPKSWTNWAMGQWVNTGTGLSWEDSRSIIARSTLSPLGVEFIGARGQAVGVVANEVRVDAVFERRRLGGWVAHRGARLRLEIIKFGKSEDDQVFCDYTISISEFRGDILNRIWKILKTVRNFTVLYIVLQVLTGVETAAAAVGLVVVGGWDLGAALAFALPLGFPLLVLQAALVLGWIHQRRVSEPLAVSDPSPVGAVRRAA